MHQFDPVSLRLFIAVCEERNIAAAAKREAIVPSAVSKRIGAMEQRIGTHLLDRGRRGVMVTPAGELLLRYAREILHTMDRMQAELSEYTEGVQGHVRAFASMSVIAEFLADDVSEFLRRYPKVKVSIDERLSSEVVRGVEEGHVDLGICWNAADIRRLQSFSYRRDRLAVMVHPSHPLAMHDSIAFEDTIDYDQVEIIAGGLTHAMLRRHAAAAGKSMRYRIQVSTVDAAWRIVAANLAIAIVPVEVTGPFVAALGLRAIPLKNVWAQRRFVICVRDADALSVPARLLIDRLREATRSDEAKSKSESIVLKRRATRKRYRRA